MRTRTAAALVAATIVGSGTVGGLTYAAVSTPAAASAQPAHPAAARGWLSRLEHAEATVRTRTGHRTLDLQRGRVTQVSATAISVRSPDGFTGDYSVTQTTRVRIAGARGSIARVHVGDRVLVVAEAGKALRVRELS
jgi:hypothetical protein